MLKGLGKLASGVWIMVLVLPIILSKWFVQNHKIETWNSIKTQSEERLQKFEFNLSTWESILKDGGNEFLWQNCLYDVQSIHFSKNSVKILAIADQREQEIYTNIGKLNKYQKTLLPFFVMADLNDSIFEGLPTIFNKIQFTYFYSETLIDLAASVPPPEC